MNVIPRYSFCDDGVSIKVRAGKKYPAGTIGRMNHGSRTHVVPVCEEFNRGIKRGRTVAITGDRPRFAMLTTYPVHQADPPPIKYGDARIRITHDAKEFWLDEADDIQTVFHPGSTVYSVTFDEIPGMVFKLKIIPAGEAGIAAKLNVESSAGFDEIRNIDLCYGGISICPRTLFPEYFQEDIADADGYELSVVDGYYPSMTCEAISDVCVSAAFVRKDKVRTGIEPGLSGNRVSFTFIPSSSADALEFCSVYGPDHQPLLERLNGVSFQELDRENEQFFSSLLSTLKINTPSAIIDAGLRTALVNLEYDYTDPAWLEGAHWWSCYWTNNFQLSAASGFGQTERVKRALLLFGLQERGYCAVGADGRTLANPQVRTEPELHYDGLPYYIYQLYSYYCQTGDVDTVSTVWHNTVAMLRSLLHNRDLNNNLLLDWHFSSNSYLYQADALGAGGDAVSPSAMMAGMLDLMGDLAGRLGRAGEQVEFKDLAETMHHRIEEILWDAANRYYYSHIDYQSIRHKAHYYTDLVFPSLYSRLSRERKIACLEHLKNSLVFTAEESGLTLMRVGDYKPSIFGSDNVMPVQMSEAARAFFKEGDSETGLALLESTAYGSTVYTEAPGNFPERMNDDGKGEFNYIFGNPIGSFAHSVIAGLFGINFSAGAGILCLSPGFPEDWLEAEIELPYISLKLSAEITNDSPDAPVVTKKYRVSGCSFKKLDFRVCLQSAEICEVLLNGKSVEYSTAPAMNGRTALEFRSGLDWDCETEILVKYRRNTQVGKGKTTAQIESASETDGIQEGSNPDDSSVKYLKMDRLYNASDFLVHFPWRHDTKHMLEIPSEKVDAKHILKTSKGSFLIPEHGFEKNTVLVVEYGSSATWSRLVKPSRYKAVASIDVNAHVSSVSLLYASEIEIRHTGEIVGGINLVYDTGNPDYVPLEEGVNMSTLWGGAGTGVEPVYLQGDDCLRVLNIECDVGRKLVDVVIRIYAADARIGVVAASVYTRDNAAHTAAGK